MAHYSPCSSMFMLQLSDAASGSGGAMWTAPVFFNVRGAGLGLTLGYATFDSLILMDNEEALDAYYKTQVCLLSHVSQRLDVDVTKAYMPTCSEQRGVQHVARSKTACKRRYDYTPGGILVAVIATTSISVATVLTTLGESNP